MSSLLSKMICLPAIFKRLFSFFFFLIIMHFSENVVVVAVFL